jgi:hypothetical protein
MRGLRQFCADVLCTSGVATAATTLAAALCGKMEGQGGLAPINAVSHIPFGDEAAEHDEASWKYTATGALLNTAAIAGWATVHELLAGEQPRRGNVSSALAAGTATSALAYITDYHLVPGRVTPGFELRLSGRSLLVIYTTLALGLATGSLLPVCRRSSSRLS